MAYVGYTVTTTAWRTQFRKQANAADNVAASKAVDSLINFEAVKVRANQGVWPQESILIVVPSISTMRNLRLNSMTNPWKSMKRHHSK